MNLNVLTSFPYTKKYYIFHPWLFIKHLWINLKNFYDRGVKGFAICDVWEMGYWLLEILPPMLRHLSENGCGYPGNEEFPTYEAWQAWLRKMADDIEAVQEENVEKQNEYEKDFHNSFNMRPPKEEHPGSKFLTITWNEAPDHKELSKKYFDRMAELEKEREVKMVEIFTELARKIPTLWD